MEPPESMVKILKLQKIVQGGWVEGIFKKEKSCPNFEEGLQRKKEENTKAENRFFRV